MSKNLIIVSGIIFVIIILIGAAYFWFNKNSGKKVNMEKGYLYITKHSWTTNLGAKTDQDTTEKIDIREGNSYLFEQDGDEYKLTIAKISNGQLVLETKKMRQIGKFESGREDLGTLEKTVIWQIKPNYPLEFNSQLEGGGDNYQVNYIGLN